MNNLKFLDNYTGQTVEELISLDKTHRIDSIVLAFETALDKKASMLGLAALSDPEQTVLAIEALEREVNNGGYQQFFINSSKEYIPIIVKALEAIGCPKIAHLTKVVILEFNKNLNHEKRLLALLEKFDEFYFERDESIEDQLYEYIKKHKNEINF